MLTNLTANKRAIERAAAKGLAMFRRPRPMRLSEWADQFFYLSEESSYDWSVGRWKTRSYQKGLMDVISNDDVQDIWVCKSARVGYTKVIMAAQQYFAVHKMRNVAIWQPTDEDRDEFCKTEIEPAIRDVPAIREIFPDFDKKSKHNTMALKQFLGCSLHLRGGKAAKNYRRLSVDVAMIDELDGFDHNIEREGPPDRLAQRRVQGASFPKFIAGSTPKLKATSMIERGEADCEVRLRWHVRCPHCDHEQHIRWGGKGTEYGIKWEKTEKGFDPESVGYQCEECAEKFSDNQYLIQARDTGRWMTEDGQVWLDDHGIFRDPDDRIVDPPLSVGFHIWTGIGEFVPWTSLVREWLSVQGKPDKLQGFVNLTLGEAWETDETEELDSELMHRTRREHYDHEVPAGVTVITAGVDVQDDRLEIQYDGWGPGEERWSLAYDVLHGDPSRTVVWDHLAKAVRRQFRKATGELFEPLAVCIDYGGHFGDEVVAFSKRMGVLFVIPCRGLSQYGKPVLQFPRKRNDKGVYLVSVGTDTAKDLMWQRLKIADPGPGYWHWPVSEDFDEVYFSQFTAEKRVRKYSRGQELYVWDAGGRRNEAWDCSALSLVAVRISQQKFGLALDQGSHGQKSQGERVTKPRKTAEGSYLPRRRGYLSR